MKKETIGIILIIILMLSVLSGPAMAAAEYSGMCGENATWEFIPSTGTLIINGTSAIYDYAAYS